MEKEGKREKTKKLLLILNFNIMKLESLYNKKIDLSKSSIYGGNKTFRECSSATTSGSCSDVAHTTTDDNGQVISMCTDYICP